MIITNLKHSSTEKMYNYNEYIHLDGAYVY